VYVQHEQYFITNIVTVYLRVVGIGIAIVWVQSEL